MTQTLTPTDLPALLAELRPVVPEPYRRRIDAALANDPDAMLRALIGPVSLTPVQWETLKLIEALRAQTGLAPTQQELADVLGVSKVTVHGTIRALEKKGVIACEKYESRSIRLVVAEQGT
jgi:DNA-binding MarR family transcriptional regulator